MPKLRLSVTRGRDLYLHKSTTLMCSNSTRRSLQSSYTKDKTNVKGFLLSLLCLSLLVFHSMMNDCCYVAVCAHLCLHVKCIDVRIHVHSFSALVYPTVVTVAQLSLSSLGKTSHVFSFPAYGDSHSSARQIHSPPPLCLVYVIKWLIFIHTFMP